MYKLIFTFLIFVNSFILFSQELRKKVGINPTNINQSAAMEIESTAGGFLLPRMTSSQRDAIISPATGLMIWCIDCGTDGEAQVFDSVEWTLLCQCLSEPSSFSLCRVPTSSGAFLDFKCHNLGADESADPLTPSWRLNGAYIQWGKRGPTGNWQTELNDGSLGFAAAPTGLSVAESNIGAISGWSQIPAANGSWNINENSPIKTINDPCPSGFRIPTRNEWNSIIQNPTTFVDDGLGTNYFSKGVLISSTLYLPFAGARILSDGALRQAGIYPYYWTSTEFNNTMAYYFTNQNINTPDLTLAFYNEKNHGHSIRCVKE